VNTRIPTSNQFMILMTQKYVQVLRKSALGIDKYFFGFYIQKTPTLTIAERANANVSKPGVVKNKNKTTR